MNQKQAFEILGLEPGVSLETAKNAYRKLAKANHPDRAGVQHQDPLAAEARMKEINLAFRLIAPDLKNTPASEGTGRKTASGPPPADSKEKTSEEAVRDGQRKASKNNPSGKTNQGMSGISRWLKSFFKPSGRKPAYHRSGKRRASRPAGRFNKTRPTSTVTGSFDDLLKQVQSPGRKRRGKIRSGRASATTGCRRNAGQGSPYSESFQRYSALKKKIRTGRKSRGAVGGIGRVEKVSAVRPVNRIGS